LEFGRGSALSRHVVWCCVRFAAQRSVVLRCSSKGELHPNAATTKGGGLTPDIDTKEDKATQVSNGCSFLNFVRACSSFFFFNTTSKMEFGTVTKAEC